MTVNECRIRHCYYNMLLAAVIVGISMYSLGFNKYLPLIGMSICIVSFIWSSVGVIRFYTTMVSKDIETLNIIGPYMVSSIGAWCINYTNYAIYMATKATN